MAAFEPFQPNVSGTSGLTVKVTGNAGPTSVSGTLDSTAKYAPSVLVVNNGTVTVFVRMSSEATPTATSSDVPMIAGSSRVFENEIPLGKLGLAVLSSTATSNDVYFVPGQGGV